MKKSKLVRLALMSLVPVSFTACNEDSEEVLVYSSLGECVNANAVSDSVCANQWAQAEKDHKITAPKYKTDGDCRAEFGNCQSVQNKDGTSTFMPLMMGYMMGSMMNNNGRDNHTYHYVPSTPLYKARGDQGTTWRTADAHSFNASGGKTVVPKNVVAPKPISTKTLSRGGFGSIASARSNWGGSGAKSGGFGG